MRNIHLLFIDSKPPQPAFEMASNAKSTRVSTQQVYADIAQKPTSPKSIKVVVLRLRTMQRNSRRERPATFHTPSNVEPHRLSPACGIVLDWRAARKPRHRGCSSSSPSSDCRRDVPVPRSSRGVWTRRLPSPPVGGVGAWPEPCRGVPRVFGAALPPRLESSTARTASVRNCPLPTSSLHPDHRPPSTDHLPPLPLHP